MPKIVNTFLKSKMNKDLDSRLIPNGEYRDANNLQLSRSQGSEVGEFENVLGNEQLTYLYTGRQGFDYTGKIIGQFTDETNNIIYIYSAGYDGDGRCPRDLVAYADPCGAAGVTTVVLYDEAGNVINPVVAGVEVGMTLWGDDWNGQPSGAGGQEVDPIVTSVTLTNIVISQQVSFAATPGCPGPGTPPGDKINIGYTNTIHRYEINTQITTLLVRGSFLNFHKDFRIYGINLIEDLLFWTDNRNQPRKINVSLANPTSLVSPIHYVNEDQISVAKYYPYETPLVLKQTIREITAGVQDVPRKGYQLAMTDTSGISIGDIVSGFPDQGESELWEVIFIRDNTAVTIYNNFKDGSPGQEPGTYTSPSTIPITFSNTTMKNSSSRLLDRGFESEINVATPVGAIAVGNIITVNYDFNNQATDPSPQPSPQVGDFITSETMEVTGAGVVGITLADNVIITEITSYTVGVGGTIVIKLNKDVTVNAVGDDISLSVNPNYDVSFTGDPDLIEEKFIRFSYRFKYEDDEYSLAAPYTQICFIPKHDGYFGGGKNEQLQDMFNAYDSSVIEWFTNQIDTISLKIPLPDNGSSASEAVTSLIESYKIKDIEILYKESDALSTKILEVINVDNTLVSFIEEIPNDTGVGPQWYYNFDYKSIKPYRTLPTSEQNRVYDNVPLKALGQEISANRVIYGNFLQKHTPPVNLNYEVIQANKSVSFNNFAQYPNHSVKQNRNYQVGFVLADRYGRASSVVLSSNDDDPNLSGSTIYVPYKSWADIGGPEADVTTGLTPNLNRTYSWLGNVLRVKLNNGITQTTANEITGEPGLYKAEEDTSCDEVTIISGGNGHVVGDVLTFDYQFGNRAFGSGLTVEVVAETGGVITGLQIIDRGTGYRTGQLLFQSSSTGPGLSAVIETVVYDANPTGWQSYKLVVKQQEQEYYNVYLPGYTSGYPTTLSLESGRVAFAVLIGDNINKIPRDLSEVGPTQSEFSASVKLFGRVNNPTIDNKNKGGLGYYYNNRTYPYNAQYFPERLSDEAVTVGSVGQGGLQLGTSPFNNTGTQGEFDNSSGDIPWGIPGEEQSYYNQQQNPLAMGLKVGAEESQPNLTQPGAPQLNTLGARVTGNAVPAAALTEACMIPFLSVSETFATETLLEIFYESSTTGNFVDLNREVVAAYGGVTGTTISSGNFGEDEASGSSIVSNFSFTDSAGNELTLTGVPTITQVIDSNGVDVTGIFTIQESVPTVYDDFDLKTNQLFWYGAPSGTKSNQWQISFQTSYDDGSEIFVDNLPNQITIDLNNIAPSIGGFTPAVGPDIGVEQACGKPGGSIGYDSTVVNYGQFTNGVNGSADVTNNTEELCYTLAVLSAPGGSTATFAIDQTGVVTKTGGSTVNGTYEFECTLTDASPSCVNSAGSLSTTCLYEVIVGTPPVNQALCFGPTSTMNTLNTECNWNAPAVGPGEPLEVFFGQSLAASSVTNGTQSYISTNIDPSITGSRQYLFNSNSDTQLRYYNVYAEARFGANAWNCGLFPPVTPAFTTGALFQGVLNIECILQKSATAASPSQYTTDFTILYRPTSADPWQLATYDQVNGLGVPGVVGNLNTLTVLGAAATSTSFVFEFSALGEYAVRNNGVRGIGCTGCTTCAEFKVDFYDATFGAVASPCTNCLGPL